MKNIKATYLAALPQLTETRPIHNQHATQLELIQASALYPLVVEILNNEDRLSDIMMERVFDYCIASIGTTPEEIANEL